MFLFSFERNAKKHHLLGSLHFFPMDALSEPVCGLIKSKKSLVEESDEKCGSHLEEYGLVKAASEDVSHINSVFDIILPVGADIPLDSDMKAIINTKVSAIVLEYWNIPIQRLSVNGVFVLSQIMIHYNGIDNVVERMFTSAGKPVFSLEGRELICDLFNDIDVSDIWMDLARACDVKVESDEFAKHNSQYGMFSNVYSEGIVSYSFMLRETHNTQCQSRNKKWLSGSEGYKSIYQLSYELEDAIFIVGCAHLFGEDGILQALLQGGYDVQRLDDNLNSSPFTLGHLDDMEWKSIYHDFKLFNDVYFKLPVIA